MMQFIFLDQKGKQLIMPVTPPDFILERGRTVDKLDMAQAGELHVSGLKTLFSVTLTFDLPSGPRNYARSDYNGNPYEIVDQLIAWSESGSVLRLIITETTVNVPVLLGTVRYGELGGARDVTCTVNLYEWRETQSKAVKKTDTGNRARVLPPSSPAASSYTVVKGDSLWKIARRQYGKGTLCYKLAAYNGIKNPNLIFPGQVIQLPAESQL